MTAAAATGTMADASLLRRLYGRYKGLALSAGATLTLGRSALGAAGEAEALVADCDSALAAAEPDLAEHLGACREAAARLRDLLQEAERGGEEPSLECLAAARASHVRLRGLVWELFDCEYVPCAATPAAGQWSERATSAHLEGAADA